MQYVESSLFLGLRLSGVTQHLLNQMNSRQRKVFINNEGPYLRAVLHEEYLYLGKYAGDKADLAKLKLLESNIYSILNKLIPNFSFQQHPLELLVIPKEETDISQNIHE
jgi:hypothetical protein